MDPNTLKTKFLEITRMKYAEQAKWFLNGFWNEGAEGEAENVWKCAQKFIELDPKKAEGNELDEFWSHKFLETLGETLTVLQLRERLRKIDMDVNGKMALLEYLLFKYKKTVQAVIVAPQGTNTEAVNEAQAKVSEAQAAFADVQQKLQDQKAALEAQKVAEEEARRALEEQRAAEEAARTALEQQKSAEAEVRKAEAELKAAVDDLRAQEEGYKNKCADLEKKSKDANSSTVTKNKAAAELAQLKQENPLPLRKAKLTQEAALRKVEKQRAEAEKRTQEAEAKAEDAVQRTKDAEAKAAEAEEKTKEAEESARQVEEAVREAEARVAEAHQFLEEVKKKSGTAHGAIWWMERELKEAQKYLPKRKQQM